MSPPPFFVFFRRRFSHEFPRKKPPQRQFLFVSVSVWDPTCLFCFFPRVESGLSLRALPFSLPDVFYTLRQLVTTGLPARFLLLKGHALDPFFLTRFTPLLS